jgi:hypothetical protein
MTYRAARAGSASPSAPAASPTSTPTTIPAAQTQALETLLAAEQAAVYAYGVVGAQGSSADRSRAAVALQRHAARRDLLAARLSAGGRRPTPAAPAYALPFPVRSRASARALAAHVESAVSDANADLVAATPAAQRVEPARWLTESATAARTWGAVGQTFPGMPERSPR